MTTYYKGFNKDLKCRGMQFEIGKTYDTGAEDTDLELCTSSVIHFCDSVQGVHECYRLHDDSNNRLCEVKPLGRIVSDGSICGTNKILIVREIKGDELNHVLGLERGNTGIFNAGRWDTGDWNIGDRNIGDLNVGSWNTGDGNTGSQNAGSCNTGELNTGSWDTGDWNMGDRNTGSRNFGSCNTGGLNIGNWNTGDWNKCNHSTGFFNTKERTITIFNRDSGMTYDEFTESEFYGALCSAPFNLTEWHIFTTDERKDSPIRKAIGGKLIQHTYKGACKSWWSKLSQEAKATIQQIPNFDAKIFKEITGIDVEKGK